MDVAHCYLDGNADAVVFCPHNGYHNVLAASTYTLQEGGQQSRHGSISLHNIDVDRGHLDMVYSEDTCGIFDIKWNPPPGHVNPFLAQADADGYLRIKMLEGCCDGVEGMDLSLDSFISITLFSVRSTSTILETILRYLPFIGSGKHRKAPEDTYSVTVHYFTVKV